MGRKAKVESTILDAEILRHREEIIGEDGISLAGTKDEVWTKIANVVGKTCKKEITPASVRVRVALNRGNIKEKLGIIANIIKESHNEDTIPNNNTISDSSDEDDIIDNNDNLSFSITLTAEEWKCIQPQPKMYQEKKRLRICQVLTPYEWSNVVQEHFFLHTGLSCCITFKKASVHASGQAFVSICGRCSECGSNFKGTIEHVPATDARVIMECSYKGKFKLTTHTKKRRLIGSAKDKALNAMITCHEAPSVYTRKEANRIMREGDHTPAQIPNLASLRQAKSKALAMTRLHSDPIVALAIMSENQVYGSVIREIGYKKFFVHFWSDLQIKVYNEYYLKIDVPSISFDATGGCCKKIRQSNGQLGNSIFLYEGVMKVNDKSFTVLSMLSERHDVLSIYMWLKRWIKCGARVPKEVVCDQSLALMSALVQAFTQHDSLEKYLNVCFSLVASKENESLPSCYVRNDINHFVHLVAQWKPLKVSKYPRTKQLFCRAMGMLVFCKTMSEAEKILEAMFIVAMSKFDGPILMDSNSNNENSEIKTPCARSKLFLQNLITSNIVELVDNEQDTFSENINNNDEEEEILEEDYDNLSSFKEWAKKIAMKCEELVEGVIGEYDNAQYLPELVQIIINTMKLFPCWSALMTPIFGYGEELASSSRIESQFNHLKNRLFKNDVMPLRVDTFTEKIVEYYRGDNLLLQSLNKELNEKEMASNYKDTSFYCEDEFLDNCTKRILVTERSSQNVDSSVIPRLQKEKRSSERFACIACKNNDMPTGLHRCIKCDKPVHLFGCSVAVPDTEEGCGEKRLCLDCNENNIEANAIENWKGKGKAQVPASKPSRPAKSYLNKQPGFNQLDLNKKGKVTPIALLKNGSSLTHKPVSVPGKGKVLLTNSCSSDSLLTILACSAADSKHYRQFLSNRRENDKTASFALDMIDSKSKNKLYLDRVKLLMEHYQENYEQLIGGITLIDTMDTVTSIAKKLCKEMPSFYRKNICTNLLCGKPEIQNSTTVISLNAYEGEISLQDEIDILFSTTTVICDMIDCGQERKETLHPLPHILVELVAVPQDLHTSESFEQQSINLPPTSIKKNYAGSVMWQLEEIPKKIKIENITYNLRGFVAFSGPDRGNLRYSCGHYMAYSLRTNNLWEFYDDTRDKVQVYGKKNRANIELLCYTI